MECRGYHPHMTDRERLGKLLDELPNEAVRKAISVLGRFKKDPARTAHEADHPPQYYPPFAGRRNDPPMFGIDDERFTARGSVDSMTRRRPLPS